VTAQFHPGDRIRHKPLMGDGGAPIGTVVRAYSEDSVWVRWSDEDAHEDNVGNIVHVPVTAEHVGQWARGKDPHGEGTYAGRVEDIHQHDTVGLRLPDDDYVEVEDAVLVAAPSPVTAPEWVPTVGARAIVAVAEFQYADGEYGQCHTLREGDVVTLAASKYRSSNWSVTAPDGSSGHLVAAQNLRSVPVAPAPDQDDEPVWRVGGNYNLHAYADEPWDVDPTKDRPVATFHRPADAALSVSRVNAHAALTARAEHAEAEVQRLRRESDEAIRRGDEAMVMAGNLREQRDRARETGRSAADHALACEAERDAARAELAATGTTGDLGQPEVDSDIDALAAAIYSAAYGIDYAVHPWAWTNLSPRHKPKYLALARLAQEAPTTKDEE